MTVAFGVYIAILAASLGFFAWVVYALYRNRRNNSLRHDVHRWVGPESEPTLVALYCQYLLAPEAALKEARVLRSHVSSRSPSRGESDFLTILDELQAARPTTTLH